MGWLDDWTATDYVFKGEDFDALYNAVKERKDGAMKAVFPDSAYWNTAGGTTMNFGVRYPNGLFPQPTPPPDNPPKIPPAPAVPPFKNPIDLQDPALYQGIQEWITAFCWGGSESTTLPCAAKDIDYDGKDVVFHPGIYGWFVDTTGYLATTGLTSVAATVDDIRVMAGMPSYKGKEGYLEPYSFRRRMPRTIVNPIIKGVVNPFAPHDYNTVGPQDTEGNECSEGAIAWYSFSGPDGIARDKGWLIKYDGVNKIWNYLGQPSGEMPDILDTEKERPFYAKPGKHAPSDYIDGHFLNDLKTLLKNIYLFTGKMYVDATNTDENGNGDYSTRTGTFAGGTPPYPDFPTSIGNAIADYNARTSSFSLFKGLTGKMIAAHSLMDNDGNILYQVTVQVGRTRWTGDIDNTVNRDISVFIVSSDWGSSFPITPTVEFFDFTGILQYHEARLAQNLANPPARFSITDRWPNNDIPPSWPAGAAAPPDSTVRNENGPEVQYSFETPAAYYVADYSVAGGFQYL